MQRGGRKRTRTRLGIDGWGSCCPPLPFRVSEIWQTIMRLSFITNARQLNKLLDGATLQAIITTFHMHPGVLEPRNHPFNPAHPVTGSGSTGNLYPFFFAARRHYLNISKLYKYAYRVARVTLERVESRITSWVDM